MAEAYKDKRINIDIKEWKRTDFNKVLDEELHLES